ncbi:MAG: PHP-associated domain-containing protein [Chloroflexota bacterium]|nr:PHP-associated domain-containing protein [Chloroflexota bacterium]
MTPPVLQGRADLHIHTTASDGIHTLRQVLDHVARRGNLDVIAITDHDRLDASLTAYSQRHLYDFEIVPGLEVTTADGHVLALWVTSPIPKGMSLSETTAAIHEQNGVAVLAHPLEPTIAPHTFWRYLTQPEVLQQSGVDAVEVFNAGAFTPGCNRLARYAYHRSTLPQLGNSDSHMVATIGSGYTRFKGCTALDLRESIERGDTAAEGTRWGITVYLRLSRSFIQRTLTNSSMAKRHSVHQTPASS